MLLITNLCIHKLLVLFKEARCKITIDSNGKLDSQNSHYTSDTSEHTWRKAGTQSICLEKPSFLYKERLLNIFSAWKELQLLLTGNPFYHFHKQLISTGCWESTKPIVPALRSMGHALSLGSPCKHQRCFWSTSITHTQELHAAF